MYVLWVIATYLLEGLPGTLVRPEAVGLRLAYALVANLALGILLPLWLIGRLVQSEWAGAGDFGFSGLGRTAFGIAAGLVGATVRIALRPWSRVGSVLIAVAVASVLFGAYHFVHSPPFNEAGMVAFLTGIGFATGAWWFASRDVYGTSVFHNFFGVTGVLAALRAGGHVPEHPEPAVPLLVTAAAATLALVWPAERWIRRRDAARTPRP